MTAYERQKALKKRREEAGSHFRKGFWITPEQDAQLRDRFPGHSNGIRWKDVIAAALSAQPKW